MLISPAAAETVAQTDSTTAIPEWGVTGAAPQTGSSAYTSGKAFSAPNSQQDTAAPAIPAEASPSSAPAAQAPKAIEQPASKILIMIDKPTQEMKVFVDNVERYTWEVSTGQRGYDTPSGTYMARSMNEIWYSKQWDDAPMPHAIFFTKKGHAIHGTEETKKLGRPASHGCVRLAPENASALFALVEETGLENTEIVLIGDTPSEQVRVASHGSRKQQVKPPNKAGTMLNRGMRAGKSKVVSSGPRKPKISARKPKEVALSGGAKLTSSGLPKQEIKPSKKLAYPYFDPRDLETPRRLSRREWLRLYYSSPPQISPPRYEYELPLRRRRSFQGY
jgi:lipoprotein-anchoring transpeptidase ErfK/SrfK